MKDAPDPIASYEDALARTDPARIGSVAKGSPEEKAAVDRFIELFGNLTAETVRAKARSVYAPDAYFNDTLKTLIGAEAIEAHLVRSAEAAEQITVDVVDVAESDGDYYLRWVMDVRFKSLKKGQVVRSIGVSHIRFNQAGQVVLHQDYWDAASGLFEHIPVVGRVLSSIKKRL